MDCSTTKTSEEDQILNLIYDVGTYPTVLSEAITWVHPSPWSWSMTVNCWPTAMHNEPSPVPINIRNRPDQNVSVSETSQLRLCCLPHFLFSLSHWHFLVLLWPSNMLWLDNHCRMSYQETLKPFFLAFILSKTEKPSCSAVDLCYWVRNNIVSFH